MLLISRVVYSVVILSSFIGMNAAHAANLDAINIGDGLDLNEKKACAVQMCGAPVQTVEVPAKLKAAHTRIFEREFKSGLVSLLNLKVEEAKLYVNLADSVGELAKVALSDRAKSIVNLFWAIGEVKHIGDFLDMSTGTMTIRPGYEVKLPHLSSADQVLVKSILENFFAHPRVIQGNIFDEYDLTTAMRVLFPTKLINSTIEQVKLEFAQDAMAKFNYLKKIWPEFPFQAPRALKVMLEGKEPTSAQVKDLGGSLSQLALIDLIEDTSGLYRARTPNLNEILPSVVVSAEFQALKKSLAESELLKLSAFQSCRDSVAETFRVHLTERDYPAAVKLSEEVKQSAIDVVKDLFKNDSQAVSDLSKVLTEINVGLPKTTKQQVLHFRGALAAELRETRNSLSALKKASPELKVIYMLLAKPSEDETLFSETTEFCKENNLKTISDHAIPGLKIVNAGWETVRYPETGRAVMAHEFGHHLFAVFDNAAFIEKLTGTPSKKTEQFGKLRQCLAAKHGEQEGRVDTSNEDFADWFAAKVAVRLQKRKIPVRNKGCLLLNGGAGEYGSLNGITLKWPKAYSDNHSPSFFRLLEFAIESGKKIPAQCEASLTKVLPREATSSCGF